MFADILKESFPHDERSGLYCTPKLPAVKLGKILRKETRISSPSDVVAMHLFSTMFDSGYLIFTKNRVFYPKGDFLLEDIKEFQHKKSKCTVFVSQKGDFVPHHFSVQDDKVAGILAKVFSQIAYFDPKSEEMVQQAATKYKEQGFEGPELDWLKLRDEVMRTIDMLYNRYNDGKLSLLEYESKKEELMGRL